MAHKYIYLVQGGLVYPSTPTNLVLLRRLRVFPTYAILS